MGILAHHVNRELQIGRKRIVVVAADNRGAKILERQAREMPEDPLEGGHAELLAQKMGGKGEYAVYVGSLTVPLHNAWADYAIAYLGEKYPEMTLIGERYGVAESVDDSRKTALDLMAANPGLKGFLAFGSQGPIGAGRAIEERRMIGQVHVLGPFSPGQGRDLVKSGAISGGFMWNPAEAGRVFVTIGKMLVDGVEIVEGTDIPGLGVVSPDAANRDIITDNLIAINAQNLFRQAEPPLSLKARSSCFSR